MELRLGLLIARCNYIRARVGGFGVVEVAAHAGVLPLFRQFRGMSGKFKGNHAAVSGKTPA